MRSYFCVAIDIETPIEDEYDFSYKPTGKYVRPNLSFGDLIDAAKLPTVELAEELAVVVNDRLRNSKQSHCVARVVYSQELDSRDLLERIKLNGEMIRRKLDDDKVIPFPSRFATA